jgi:hypothetical protein
LISRRRKRVLFSQRDWDVWRTVHQLALHAARQRKDLPGEAKYFSAWAGPPVTSATSTHPALVITKSWSCTALGDHRGEARALHHLGSILRLQGDYSAARVLYDDALALYRVLGKRHGKPISHTTSAPWLAARSTMTRLAATT